MKKAKKLTIACTGGGSGGHVFPAFGVLDEVTKRAAGEYHYVWIGSRTGVERKLVDNRGIEFYGLSAGKLRRYFSLRNVLDAFKFILGIFEAIFLLAKLRPQLLFSKGGFVSVGPVIAAGLLKIPVIGHESDYDPGLATRINLRFTAIQCIPFPESGRYYPESDNAKKGSVRIVATGNPVRNDVSRGRAEEGRRIAGFSNNLPLLLVQGGSLGARQINELISLHGAELLAKMCIIHQTGDENWGGASLFPEELRHRYFSAPFFSEEYPHILASADLVLSRAGAGSLWELGLTRKPAVFVPLVEGARGDQLRNARFAVENNAALLCYSDDDFREFASTVTGLISDGTRLSIMADSWNKIIHNRGAANIAGLILETIESHSREES